jgi:arabinose-5-phosphate isomerase
VVLALSHSGETAELVRLVEAIRRIGATLDRASRANPDRQRWRRRADVVAELCTWPRKPARSTSRPRPAPRPRSRWATRSRMALARRKGFREEDFANLHPGGTLGKRLMRVESLMHAGDALPTRRPRHAMPDVIHEITEQTPRHDVCRRR